MNGDGCGSDKVGECVISPLPSPPLSLSPSDFSLLFHLPPFNPSLRFLHPFTIISLAFHSSRSYLTVCTLRFLIRAIFSSTSSLFRHISRSFLGRSREPRPILLTLHASSTATCSGVHRPRKRERIICVTGRHDYRRKNVFWKKLVVPLITQRAQQ